MVVADEAGVWSETGNRGVWEEVGKSIVWAEWSERLIRNRKDGFERRKESLLLDTEEEKIEFQMWQEELSYTKADLDFLLSKLNAIQDYM